MLMQTSISLPFAMSSGRGRFGPSQTWRFRLPACCYDSGRCTMGLRLQLQSLLETITEHVFFQPPTNSQIQYPCIVYRRNDIYTLAANNEKYRYTKRYLVTVIDSDPDSA